MSRSGGRLLATIVAGAALAACGGGGDDGTLRVAAAASLTDAFTELGAAFEATHPDTEVTFNFAGSSELVAQMFEGAPVDVFASADLANMDRLVDAQATRTRPVVFATNRAAIVVEPGNPLGIDGVDDLRDDLIVVTCAPEVPCGGYAAQIFDAAGVVVTPDSFEENVRAVVTKVALGEADAGIAYATDLAASDGRVDGVEIPAAVNVVAQYPIVVPAEGDRERAQPFVDFVLGPEGRAILADFGFGVP